MAYKKEYYEKHKEEIIAKRREYYAKNRDKINSQRRDKSKSEPQINAERCRKYRSDHLDECRARELEYCRTHRGQKHQYDAEYRKLNKEKYRACQIARRQYIWGKALAFFGPCACCGEDRIPFLTIDHKNGGGNQSRAKGERFGWGLLSSWERAGWPEEIKKSYRILCHNCNQATRYGAICPHQEEKESGIW
jgi:hypothetical protein